MRSSLALIALLMFTAAVPSRSADFWEKKKYPEWSKKEIQRMLTDSPWARPVEFHPDPAADDEEKPGRATCEGCSGGGPKRTPELAPTVMIVVRWQSALPVKQAMAAARFGAEVTSTREAIEFLGRQEPFYVITVAGLPQEALPNPDKLKANVVLNARNKSPLPVAEVKVQAQGKLAAVYFAFPRSQPIVLEDQETEFSLQLGSSNVRRKFRLEEMVFDGKLEL